MSLIDLLQDPAPPIAAVQGRYLLQGLHRQAGNAVAEGFADLNSAVTRASELIRAGYDIEIWSPTSLESQCRSFRNPRQAIHPSNDR